MSAPTPGEGRQHQSRGEELVDDDVDWDDGLRLHDRRFRS